MDTKIKEAYKVMQAEWVKENDVRVGDTVRILRCYISCELGCSAAGCNYTGRQGIISGIYDAYLYLGPLGQNPFFVLEIVDQPRETEEMVEIKGKKWSKSTIAEALRQYAG